MTREELEKAMGNEPKIQASFEVIGDDAKFIKLIVNGSKEKVVSVEELKNTPSETYRETDDYENEIADLHNRLDIAEYDKERFREEITVLEEKLKALSVEHCEDCISRKAVLDCFKKWQPYMATRIFEYEQELKALPSIQPTAKENLVVEDCISRAELLKAVDTWDRFGCDAGSSKLVPIKDCYVSYIHYDDVVKAIKGMPSIQPKTDVLDKIRAEIEFIPTIEWKDDGTTYILASYFKKQVLEIIDKYMEEKE